MPQTIKLTDLLDSTQFEQHKDHLVNYFQKGGTWQELLNYDDNLLQTQYQKAYDLYQKADYKNAAALFSYLTVLNPYHFNFWMGLGMAKQSDRLYEEAIVSYTTAEAMHPENPIPHLHMAQCFYGLNLRDLAIEHLKKAIEVSGDKQEYKDIRLKATTILENLPK